MKPTVGRIVQYASKNGDGIISPAIVLRTRDTTNLGVIERWGPSPEGTLSGKGRPADLVPELPDDFTVDLLVWALVATTASMRCRWMTRRGLTGSRTSLERGSTHRVSDLSPSC